MHSIHFHAVQPFAWGLLIAIASSCGGAAPEPATPSSSGAAPATSAATASAPSSSSGSSWSKDMSKDQKMTFMKTKVVPAMRPVFQGHDANRYGSFDCKTCHGPQYKDPHDVLPRLVMKDGKLTAFAEKPEVAQFMAESVAPKMAATMGLPPYDPATHQGFGCGGCHAIDRK